jgi:hypothetical protein
MLIFRCDICQEIADKNVMRYHMAEGREDICAKCLDILDKCADLMNQPGFKEQLVDLHAKMTGKQASE